MAGALPPPSIFPLTIAGNNFTLDAVGKLNSGDYPRDSLQACFNRFSGTELGQAPPALKANFPPQPAAVGTVAQRAEAKKQFDELTLERFLTNITAHPEVVAKTKELSKGRAGGGGGGGEDALIAAVTASSSSKGAQLRAYAALAADLVTDLSSGGGHGGLKTDSTQDLAAILSGTAPINSDPAKPQAIKLLSQATSVETRSVILFCMVVVDAGLTSMHCPGVAAAGFKEKGELATFGWSMEDMKFPLPTVSFGATAQIEIAAERALQKGFFSNINFLKPASALRLTELGKRISGYLSGFLRRVERLSPVGDLLPGIIIYLRHLLEEGTLLVIDRADTSNDGSLGAQITSLHLQLQKEEHWGRAHKSLQAALLSATSSGGGGGGGGGGNRFNKRPQDSQGKEKTQGGGSKTAQAPWLKALLEKWAKMPPKCPTWATRENWDKPRGETGEDTCLICRPGQGRDKPKCNNKRKCQNVGVMDGGSGSDEIWIHHPQKRYLEQHKIIVPEAGKSPREANGDFKG